MIHKGFYKTQRVPGVQVRHVHPRAGGRPEGGTGRGVERGSGGASGWSEGGGLRGRWRDPPGGDRHESPAPHLPPAGDRWAAPSTMKLHVWMRVVSGVSPRSTLTVTRLLLVHQSVQEWLISFWILFVELWQHSLHTLSFDKKRDETNRKQSKKMNLPDSTSFPVDRCGDNIVILYNFGPR